MQRRRFGRTGLHISELTFGGGWVGGLLIRGSEQVHQAVLDRAIDQGINWIDTAALYGNGASETALGGWLAGVAEERRPHISTKFNIDTLAGDHEGQIRRSVEASLGRLRLASVPLLILHSRIVTNTANDNRSLGPEQILKGGGIADIMDQLRKEGICDWIGITGLGDPEAIARIIDSGRFDTAQVYYKHAQSNRGRRWWTGVELDGLQRTLEEVRGPGHGHHGDSHLCCGTSGITRAARAGASDYGKRGERRRGSAGAGGVGSPR